MKKFFRLTKAKRIAVLIATLFATILAIVLGTTFYVAKDGKKSVEYGGGAEYVVQIASDDAKEIAADVAQSIYERLDPLGITGATAESEVSDNGATVRVTYPGTTTESERRAIETLITSKPQLVFTDIYGNPLFNERGSFRQRELVTNQGGQDPAKFIGVNSSNETVEEFYYYDLSEPSRNQKLETLTPIVSGGAKAGADINNKRHVEITLENDKSDDWTNATKYIQSLGESKNLMLVWLDPHKFLAKMNDIDPSFWENSNNSLFNLAHVDQDPNKGLWQYVINAEDYLISSAVTSQTLQGNKFLIEGNFTPSEAQNLAQQINYGVSNYQLNIISSNVIDPIYGTSAFNKAILAGAIVFGLIAIILFLNYGILGLLSTLSIALFLFLTLTAFTAMNAQYSPASIAALVIGIGMSVDAVIIMFERFKNEMYRGTNLNTGYKIANKKSWMTIFDSNFTTLIVAIVLFYFGTRSIIGLSITLILSIVFTLIVMLFFTQFTSMMLIKSNWVKNNKWLLGLKPKFDVKMQKQINKIDFAKNTKWFSLSSAIILFAGVVVFIIFAAINNSFAGGFVLSQEFAGGTSITIQLKPGFDGFEDLAKIKEILLGYGIGENDITVTGNSLVQVRTLLEFNNVALIKSALEGAAPNADVLVSNTSTTVANRLVSDALQAIGIAMALIIVYTLIRFKWTYSLAAIVALTHDVLIVVAIFVICRIQIEPIFVAALLSTVGYSINDTIVTFDRVREKISLNTKTLDPARIKQIANSAIQETFKRSMWTSLTTVLAIVILMSFGDATKMTFNIAMFVGLISGTYSSIFIATFIWTKLEIYRQKRIALRKKKGFWNTTGVEEQTVTGINDFKV